MHPPDIRAAAEELIAQGVNDCEISRRLDIPRTTIRDWRRPSYTPKHPMRAETCLRCWQAARPMRFTADDYAELLGLYLGDGCISIAPRTRRLRITLDLKYPTIIDESHGLIQRCFPWNRTGVQPRRDDDNCCDVWVYSRHLPCVFPQHGSGRKHQRAITLEPWQEMLVAEAPWALIRGLIRTDGCAFVNRTDVHRQQPYEYLSYDFTNMSEDIARIFISACERVGLRPRANCYRGKWRIRLNRRADVARLVEHVGVKA